MPTTAIILTDSTIREHRPVWSPQLHAVPRSLPSQPALTGPDPVVPFTRREREVLNLLVSGPSNRWIAEHLSISERTVEAHVANILGKLGLANRAQVAVWVARRGWPSVLPAADASRADGA